MAIHQKNTKPVNKAGKKVVFSTGVFKALSNVECFRIFRSLVKHGKLSVRDIAKILETSDSLAIKYIEELKTGGILAKRKEDRIIYYYLNLKNKEIAAAKVILF